MLLSLGANRRSSVCASLVDFSAFVFIFLELADLRLNLRFFCLQLRQTRLLFFHLKLRHRQMFLGAAALTALHIGVPGLTHILEEIVLQHAVRFFKDRLAFAVFSGSPVTSSKTGLDAHFLLILTCMTVSFTLPINDLSLHRLDQRICFSTTGT